MFENIFNPLWMAVPLVALYALYVRFLRQANEGFPSLKLLALLFLCGLSFVLVLPHAARMPYEARQMLPFCALLMAAFTWSFPQVFRKAVHHDESEGGETGTAPQVWIAAPYLLFTVILLLIVWYRFAFMDRFPVYDLGDRKEEMQFAQQLQQLPTHYEPVYFDLGGFSTYWDPNYVPGYPQILPLTEYYAGSRPILCFRDPEKSAEDILTMVRKSPAPFSPVVLSRDPQNLEKVLDVLGRAGVLTMRPTVFPQSMGRYALDLSDIIRWRDHDEANPNSRKP